MRLRYEEMTSAELAAAAASLGDAVAVLPVAAIEQHGAHLPLGTDAMLSDAMVETTIAQLGARAGGPVERFPAQAPDSPSQTARPEDHRVTFLSTLRIGASAEHSAFAGTLSLDWQNATATLIEIGSGLARAGFRRLVIVSAHGGNTASVDTAALELRRTNGLLVGTAAWLRFGTPAGLLPDGELASGIHGGAVETALMLHFRPELVRTGAIAAHPSLQDDLARSATHLRAHGKLGFGWMAGDLNPAGVVGDARLATPDIGAAIAAHQATAFCAYLDDMLAFDLNRLTP